MKTTIAATAAIISTIATAAAHPGHDHSSLSAAESTSHHLLTGGFIGASILAAAWLTLRATQKRKLAVARQTLSR